MPRGMQAAAERASAASPPLEGLRVLDAGDFVAAPYCAMLLADWGAEVIKLEGLDGDPARGVGEMVATPDISAIFASANRGKRSVTVDLGQPRGRELAHRMAKECDVVLHNRLASSARRLGLDYESLAAERPDIIVGSITAFGEDGPYAERGALDPVAQAMSGMMSVTGPVEGPPMRAGVTVVDFGAGLALVGAVLGALWARERTGRGRAVSTSLLDIGLLYSSSLFPAASPSGAPPQRLGNRSHPLLADQFATSDGFVLLAVWDEDRWQSLCSLLGMEQLGADPSLASNRARLQAYDRVRPALEKAIAGWTSRELVDALTRLSVPCAQTYDVLQVAADPHVQAIGALYDEGRFGEPFTMVSGPARIDGVAAVHPLPPPHAGDHTDAILIGCVGLTRNELRDLRTDQVVR